MLPDAALAGIATIYLIFPYHLIDEDKENDTPLCRAVARAALKRLDQICDGGFLCNQNMITR